jgi:hypothetical protein
VTEDDEELTLVFTPPLVAVLLAAEREKGAPLTEAEVLAVRDDAVTMTVPASVLGQLQRSRGYTDLDPDDCWRQWRAVREQLATED